MNAPVALVVLCGGLLRPKRPVTHWSPSSQARMEALCAKLTMKAKKECYSAFIRSQRPRNVFYFFPVHISELKSIEAKAPQGTPKRPGECFLGWCQAHQERADERDRTTERWSGLGTRKAMNVPQIDGKGHWQICIGVVEHFKGGQWQGYARIYIHTYIYIYIMALHTSSQSNV